MEQALLSCDNARVKVGKGNLSYNTPIFHCIELLGDSRNIFRCGANEEELIKAAQGHFLIHAKYDDSVVTLTKCRIQNDELVDRDCMTIGFDKKFVFEYHGKTLELNETHFFFQHAIADVNYGDALKALIYDNHVKCAALKDLEKEYFQFLHSGYNRASNAYVTLRYFYFMSEIKFCYLFEFSVKSGISVDYLWDDNPVKTGKPYNDVRSTPKISAASLELLGQYHRSDTASGMKIFQELEANPKVGVNGIKLLKEIDDTLKKIRDRRVCNDWQLFTGLRDVRSYEQINAILNTFDISIKTFTDRAMRSILTERVGFDQYVSSVYDYIEMKKALKLPIEKKMPKNIIEMHDVLAEQIRDVQEQKSKEAFRNRAKENAVLAESFNAAEPDDVFVVVAPGESKDLIEEGQNMHHCVGSYVERVINGYSKIYFVRKHNNVDESFVTIELDRSNSLIQARAKFNGDIPKDAEKYVHKFVKFAGGKICG